MKERLACLLLEVGESFNYLKKAISASLRRDTGSTRRTDRGLPRVCIERHTTRMMFDMIDTL
jgi:hypothetical protein